MPDTAFRVGGLLACLAALAGYAAFLLADRPAPAPAAAPATFGLGVADGTDPLRLRLVDDITLAARGLDERSVGAEVSVTARAADLNRPVAGALVATLPPGAQSGDVRAWVYPPGRESIVGANPDPATAVVDRRDGTLRVALPTTPGTVVVRLRFTAPASMFAWPGRTGEQSFAVDFGAVPVAPAPPPGTRPLADFTDTLHPATLRVTMDFDVSITETEMTAVPPVTRTGYREVTWAEDVTADSRLRIDGTLTHTPARFWLAQLDNLALLLLGALVAMVLDRWLAT